MLSVSRVRRHLTKSVTFVKELETLPKDSMISTKKSSITNELPENQGPLENISEPLIANTDAAIIERQSKQHFDEKPFLNGTERPSY